MKHLSIWFALILIPLALFLSAESRRPTPQPNESAALSNDRRGQQIAPVGATSTPQSPKETGASAAEKSDGSDAPTVVIAVFTVVSGLAAIAIAWFTCQLVGVTDEMTTATSEAAKFTKLAYLSTRPYVVADEFVLKNFTPQTKTVDENGLIFMVANFKLRNVGKTPAIIRSARGKLKTIADDPKKLRGLLPNPSDDWGDLSDCVALPLSARAIPADDSIAVSTGLNGLPSEADYKAIALTYDKHIVVYGSLEYTDAAGEPYEVGFGVVYRPKRMFGDDDFFTMGPAKYNWSR